MIEAKTYRTNEGVKTVLVDSRGYKNLKVLMITDHGLKVRTVPRTELRYMADVIQSRRLAKVSTLVRKFRAAGRRLGINKGAKQFLRGAA